MKSTFTFEKKIILLVLIFCLLTTSGCTSSWQLFFSSQEDSFLSASATPFPTLDSGQNESQEEGLLLTFYGSVNIDGEEQPISVKYCQDADTLYYIELAIPKTNITIPLRDDFMLDSIEHGFEVCDINSDGNDDLIIELGIYGQTRPARCFVFTEENGYIEIPEFADLSSPRLVSTSKTVIDEWHSGLTEYGIDRYIIVGAHLLLEESLYWIYENGQDPLYTESKNINGNMVIIRENLKESEIDFDYWYN